MMMVVSFQKISGKQLFMMCYGANNSDNKINTNIKYTGIQVKSFKSF